MGGAYSSLFRPCIDIHNGAVKQIVGSSLKDGDAASLRENFVSAKGAEYFARLWRAKGLKGGHVIILNPRNSPFYEDSKREALAALKAFPGGMMAGGGCDEFNSPEFIEAGASHVIATSSVFTNGALDQAALDAMERAVGREHLALDLSCRVRDGKYYVVTDRWQKWTDFEVNPENLSELSGHCDEFLVHGVDVEGKAAGADMRLFCILSSVEGIGVTYAGGIRSLSDIALIREAGRDRVGFTIGSALDIYGGSLRLKDVIAASVLRRLRPEDVTAESVSGA